MGRRCSTSVLPLAANHNHAVTEPAADAGYEVGELVERGLDVHHHFEGVAQGGDYANPGPAGESGRYQGRLRDEPGCHGPLAAPQWQASPREEETMLMPGVSVTAIGLAIAAIAIARGGPTLPALLRGLIGAWVGFAGLALIGLAIDVILFDGAYVAVLGHIGAAISAAIAVSRVRAQRHT